MVSKKNLQKTTLILTLTASGISVTADGCLLTSNAISLGMVAFSLNLQKKKRCHEKLWHYNC